MNSITKTETSLFAAGAAVMSLASVFLIASAFAVPKETVKFRDLNVSNPPGVIALSQRIHVAAQRVCFADSIWGTDEATQRAKDCANEAEARAVAQVNVPALTAYYKMNVDHAPTRLIASLAK
jgi:UrcA family protein